MANDSYEDLLNDTSTDPLKNGQGIGNLVDGSIWGNSADSLLGNTLGSLFPGQDIGELVGETWSRGWRTMLGVAVCIVGLVFFVSGSKAAQTAVGAVVTKGASLV